MAKITKIAQRSALAVAALAAMAGAAQAQNVTIYGRIDVGIEHRSKAGAVAGSDDSVTVMQNGGILPSIWGFRGSEDIGGGMKAVFNLEGDFDGDTGGTRFGGNLQLFGRQANVGLSGDFGTVLLGRQYAPALLAELGVDPRGYKESFSALLPYALAQIPEANTGLCILGFDCSKNNFGGIFTGNMVSYTGAFGPVTLRAGYGLGEVAGETSDGQTISLGATYSGPITVAASYQEITGLDVGGDAETQRIGLGVAVPFGAITFKAIYAMSEADDGAGVKISDADFFGIGVNWNWNPSNTLTVAWYHGDDDEFDGKTNDIVISNDYALSKRTTVYAQLIHTDVDDGANPNLSIAADRFPFTDEKTTYFSVGIMHSF